MQQTSERKVRGARTLCVTLASRHGQARLSERNFTTVLTLAEENVDPDHAVQKQIFVLT
jgi:hypothetical protein